jgi:hypothetical protein
VAKPSKPSTPKAASEQASTCRIVLSVGVGIRRKQQSWITFYSKIATFIHKLSHYFLYLIKNSIIMSKKNLTQEQGDSIKEIVGKIIDLIVKLTKGK